MVEIGILALQGDFDAHARALRGVGALAREVRRCHQLHGLDGLVMPGGESTTLLNLMTDEPWFEALREFHRDGGALFGTCAGAILLAREVRGPRQPSLALIDTVVERNAYGRQRESFETSLNLAPDGESIRGVFIRAPRFRELGPGVEVLTEFEHEPVLIREDRVLAGTFHPELTGNGALHRLFVGMASQPRPVAAAR